MVTDVVCEYLVKRNQGKKETLKMFGIVAGAILILLLLTYWMIMVPGVTALVVMLDVAVVYFAVKLFKTLSVEYEYCFVNGELTIDKIINQSDRKRMTVLETKKVEKVGKYDSASFNKETAGNIYNYSSGECPTDAIYLQLRNDMNGIYTIIISCPDEFIAKMKPYFNQLVYREGFGKR